MRILLVPRISSQDEIIPCGARRGDASAQLSLYQDFNPLIALDLNSGRPFAYKSFDRSPRIRILARKVEPGVGGIVQKRSGSWLGLVGFCATYALAIAIGLALLFASVTVAFGIAQSLKPSPIKSANVGSPPPRTFAGVVTDSDCIARHDMDSGKNPSECTRACVRNGAKFALVDGGKVYMLEGDQAVLDKLAGQRVEVAGTLNGNTITLSATSAH